jgi:myosin heavy subunit
LTLVDLSQYLLEKSRVVRQAPGEGNYHIFSFLIRGLAPEKAAALGLRSMTEHAITKAQGDGTPSAMASKANYHKDMLQLVRS